MPTCHIEETTFARGVRALRIENDLLATTVLIDKGADIYELIYKPRLMDVLWKAPWGLKPTNAGAPTIFSSEAAWMEYYAGGWQDIFPSGGGPCTYKNVELNFHGEASIVAWDYDITHASGDMAEVALSTRLYRSPFKIERIMRVEAGVPALIIRQRITNEGGESMDYMWGQHPAYGAPFLSEACRIDVGAPTFLADADLLGTANPLTPGTRYTWPQAEREGAQTDMSRIPDMEAPRDILAYFENFDSGWYGITNTELGFGVGLVWPKEIFPYAWFWQEMHGSAGYPWYKAAYVMAIEPFTSIPGAGLVRVMEAETHQTLAAGASVEAEFRAVFYESTTGISGIAPDGTVTVR